MKKSEFTAILNDRADRANALSQSGDPREAAKGESDLELCRMIGHIVVGFDPEDAPVDPAANAKPVV